MSPSHLVPVHSAKPPTFSALRRLACFVALSVGLLPRLIAGPPAAPPDFPDSVHVPNGCQLSATAYLAKFSAQFPDERVRPLAIKPRGWPGGHTIAIVSWQGEWFGRDEYLGVFAVGQNVGSPTNPKQLAREATAALEAHSSALAQTGQKPIPLGVPRRLIATLRNQMVAAAAALVPFPSEQFRARCGNEELAFLFFRPAAGQVAVYDPTTGTVGAECVSPNGADIVAAVAARLGYRVTAVRRAFSPPTGPRVAGLTAAQNFSDRRAAP